MHASRRIAPYEEECLDLQLILTNLLNPPILFFFLGMAATLVRSDLDIAKPIAKFISVYLLFSIGMHGGVELSRSGFGGNTVPVLLATVVLASAVPVWSFYILRRRLSVYDAGAIAATYGSISAVTFITALSFLDKLGESHSGFMVAAMALMESPAIIVGVLLIRLHEPKAERGELDWKTLGHEAFFSGAVILLMGSLLIGILTGEKGWEAVKPFTDAPFKGVLCLFLLDMGLAAALRIRDLRKSGLFLVSFGLIAPPVHALIGILVGYVLGVSQGDALLLAVLSGSASYIAVPAAIRMAVPQANPSLYVPMSLALTFPFNVTIGIPLYMGIIRLLW